MLTRSIVEAVELAADMASADAPEEPVPAAEARRVAVSDRRTDDAPALGGAAPAAA